MYYEVQRISGGRSLARPFRDPPIPLATIIARTEGLHVRRESLGFVHRSRTIFCRPVPNLMS
jgi:hypothetical protein